VTWQLLFNITLYFYLMMVIRKLLVTVRSFVISVEKLNAFLKLERYMWRDLSQLVYR